MLKEDKIVLLETGYNCFYDTKIEFKISLVKYLK